jgi:hypothetical protein
MAPATGFANWSSDPRVNLPVCTHDADQQMPRLLPDGYGGAWIAWIDARVAPNHADIYANHILAPGVMDPAWPVDGLAVCTAWSAQMEPMLVPDGGSGFFVCWWDQRTSGSNPDLYFQHVLPNGTVDPGWPVNGAPVMTSLDNQYPPFVLPDGVGGVYFCFGDNDGTSNNVYAQHMLGSGVRDPAWPEAGLKLCWVIGSQLYPHAISDGAGGMLVVWGDDRALEGGVYATRVLSSGSIHPDWPANGFSLCTAAGTLGSVKLVSDGSGGAIVVWRQGASLVGDIFAHHLLANGTRDASWPAGGLAVCMASGEQAVPQVVSDGAHGAVLVWQDKRSGNYDLYAHHILASGAVDPSWPVDGRPLVVAPGDQGVVQYGSLHPDGTGGALCVWRDGRLGALVQDVYAGHILASGVTDPTWPTNGLGVCLADSNQSATYACADGSGGLIAAWPDKRSGAYDIYAQRVAANGTLPNVSVEDAATATLRMDARPNPAMAGTVLRFSLPAASHVRLEVFDVRGRLVQGLADEDFPPGAREIRWNLKDSDDRAAPPGLYLVRLVAGMRIMTSRVIVLAQR